MEYVVVFLGELSEDELSRECGARCAPYGLIQKRTRLAETP